MNEIVCTVHIFFNVRHLAILFHRPPKPEAYWDNMSHRDFEELILAVGAQHD